MKINANNKSTPLAFVTLLAQAAGAKNSLRVNFSDFQLFDEFKATELEKSRELLQNRPQAYDFIVADLPLGWRSNTATQLHNGRALKIRQNWSDVYAASSRLLPGGFLVADVEPGFPSNEWNELIAALRDLGVYHAAALRFPFLQYAGTSLAVTLCVFTKSDRTNLLVADVTQDSSLQALAESVTSGFFGATISDGLPVAHIQFHGFDQLLVSNEIQALETQYKGYKQCRLVPDLALPENVFLCRSGESHVRRENAVYIPKIGDSPVLVSLDAAALKDQNYIQIVLNSKEAAPAYLALYFRSHLGKLTLRSLKRGSIIQQLSKAALGEIVVPVPNQADQEMLILAHSKLLELDQALMDFRNELSLNPRSAGTLVEHADSMLHQVHRLSAADEILAMIRKGESRTLEFKQTLSMDVKKQTKEAYIEKAVLKTIAAFLNSQGGTLLVGVADDGSIPGLRAEMNAFFKSNRDELLKHFKNILKRSVGETFYPLIDYDTVEMNGDCILRIDCRQSDKECFLDSTEFYVRANPATDQLNGQKMIEYIRQRFKS